jgi:hypothetical protein
VKHLIYLSLITLITSTGCEYLQKQPKEDLVAKVGKKYLYRTDLTDIIPAGIAPRDSILIAQKFIDNWIRKELMLQKAELNLSDTDMDFEKQLDDYRASLIIYKYQQQLLNQKLDTLISEAEIERYYEENQSNFVLSQNAIRGMFIKVPRGAPNIDKIKGWYRNENDTPLLENYGYQFAVKYDYFNDDWFYLDHLLREIPIEINDQERFLRNNRYIETNDSLYYYFAGIKEYKLKSSISPVSLVKENIKNIIMNKRKLEFLKNLEKNVYSEAVSKNLFELY